MDKKKTIESWLMELPAGYRELALKNMDEPMAGESASSLSSAICSAFRWSKSPEGLDFWDQVRDWSVWDLGPEQQPAHLPPLPREANEGEAKSEAINLNTCVKGQKLRLRNGDVVKYIDSDSGLDWPHMLSNGATAKSNGSVHYTGEEYGLDVVEILPMKSKIKKSDLEKRIKTLEDALKQYAGLAERLDKLEKPVPMGEESEKGGPKALSHNCIDWGEFVEDANTDRFIKTDTGQYVYLSNGEIFEFSDLCHPLIKIDIGVTLDGGETWTEI